MVLVKVRDMEAKKIYKVDSDGSLKSLKLISITMSPGGAGGSGNQEPSFELTFAGDRTLKKSWDDVFEEVTTTGGKRKSRRNKKSRKTRRKSSRR